MSLRTTTRGVARVLSLARDPGPQAAYPPGSGFLSFENDDRTAERTQELILASGLGPVGTIPGTSTHRRLSGAGRRLAQPQVTEGVRPLGDLGKLLPRVRVVVLRGGDAQTGWKRLTLRHPDVAALTASSRRTRLPNR